MRKFFSKFSSLLLLTPVVFTTACSFSFLGIDLNTLPNYDWTKEEPYFKGYPSAPNVTGLSSSGNVNYLKNQRYIDYKSFNTGYKNDNSVKKQAVTGVPLNSAFVPNGNYLKDFGENSKALMFQQVNSILNWDSNVDYDAKYNQSDYPLIKSTKVANKWVNSQDSRIKTLIMGLVVKHASGMNSVVGTNRIFDYGFNNWQYADRYAAWAGASSEGIIIPPAADAVDAAHINGTKIYGQIFLDGYHGLTKSMLKDFLQKDNNGNYKIVNVLINMARYMGFDGWFYNNEPNGAFPNGFIMNSQESVNILNQFKATVAKSSDPIIQNLEMISYKNQGTLQYLSQNQQVDPVAGDLANSTNGLFLQDFYTYPNQSWQWSQNHPQYNSFDIYNMYNLGGWVNSKIFYDPNRIGTRDVRELTQQHIDSTTGLPYTDIKKENSDMNHNKWGFDNNNINSIGVFAATTATDLANGYLNSLKRPIKIEDDIFANMYANYYDDMVYTGQHRYLSNQDKGSTSWDPSFNVKGLSYGIGDLEQENTVLFDNSAGENNVPFFKTNFSTGQGQFFVQDDGQAKIENYPWNNKRLSDTQPTYKWDIRNSSDDATGIANPNIMGYYDYYDAYNKGNSLALGAVGTNSSLGFDTNGKIKPTAISSNIDWNIMGTNYFSNQKQVDFTYKISDADGNSIANEFNIDLIITLNDGTTSVVNGTISTTDANNWITLHADKLGITPLPGNVKIAKLGLRIKPKTLGKTTPVKFNVGQLKISKTGSLLPPLPASNATYITNLSSEYAIERDNYYSLRLNWTPDVSLHEQIAYYEVYLQKGNGECYFLGATANNNYYVKNLSLDSGSRIIIKTVNQFQQQDSRMQAWNLV